MSHSAAHCAVVHIDEFSGKFRANPPKAIAANNLTKRELDSGRPQ
jgi:hypothetical protein